MIIQSGSRGAVIRLCVALVLCSSTSCSKSITSIGSFEGEWSGRLYFTITDDTDRGTIVFTVESDRTLKGYGEVLNRLDEPPSKWYEIHISGQVNANGALVCQCEWNWIVPGEEKRSGHSKIEGYLNPALNYGKGYFRVYEGILAWTVSRKD